LRTRINASILQLNKNTLRSAVRRVTTLLSLFVVLGVFWSLKLTGITMAGEAFCGMDEHRHGDSCPTGKLICGQAETSGHAHDETCILRELICEQEEVSPHVHDESCLDRELICTETERDGHTHDDTCRAPILICTEEEQDGHTHGDDCFTTLLVCSEEESPAHTEEEPSENSETESPEYTEEESAGHTHTSECYETVLTCETEEFAGHHHGEDCYLPGDDLTCGQEECEAHTHGDACYLLHEGSFTCGMEETEGHSHTEACFYIGIGFGCGITDEGHIHTDECLTEETELGCGKESAPAHTHTEACYEALTECPLEEHIHTESCYSNLDADLETEDDWEDSLRDVPEEISTAETLAAVARSQLGYTESTLNFEVDLHGVRRGITRYGQWYGNPYGDWSAMFVSFCLHYAGAADLPANAGPESMRLEWEEAGLYEPADIFIPQVGNLLFLSSGSPAEEADESDFNTSDAEPMDLSETDAAWAEKPAAADAGPEEAEVLYLGETDAASSVAIITDVTENSITIIQGDLNDTVSERTIAIDDPTILGYGLVPECSPFALMMLPRAGELNYVGRTINYNANMFTSGRSFVIYAEHEGQYYALISQPASGMETTVDAVPIEIAADGSIYTDVSNPDSLLWNFTRSGSNYVIRNAATGRNLHPGGDYGIIYNDNSEWPTALWAKGTGAQFVHTENSNNVGLSFNPGQQRFETIASKSNASTLYFGVAERCTVWLDGTNGGLSGFGGSANQSYSVIASSQMTLPSEWLSPTKYHYRLRGWYDVTHNQYYAPGETVTITENTVFYADWMADTYDIGKYNAEVANTVSTNSFITTRLFDYNYLFNVLSADPSGSSSSSSHSETWSIVRDETVNYENRESLNFIFLDYGDGGTLDYPNNRQNGVNAYPGEDIVTGGIYNSDIGEALFATDDHLPGKVYLGTADHLFQIMDDADDPYYGYYYYDSSRNAASYNQSDERFYVYDYLEATSAELTTEVASR